MNEATLSTYRSPLRAAQKAGTRQRILDAAGRLMGDSGLGEFSFATIAKEAGVQERTVYRHFASRVALFDALWQWLDPRIGLKSFPRTEEELVAGPKHVFPAFDEHEGLMRAFWATNRGREFRLRVNPERQAAFLTAVASAAEGLEPAEARWLAAVCQLLYSGAAWQTMKDYWDFSGAEAGKASSFAIETLLTAARKPQTKRR